MTQLRSLPVILPPLELQNEFAAFIEQLDKSKVTIRKSIEKLETTYRALLQEYFG
jgi:type I restriction enzyme S subunit